MNYVFSSDKRSSNIQCNESASKRDSLWLTALDKIVNETPKEDLLKLLPPLKLVVGSERKKIEFCTRLILCSIRIDCSKEGNLEDLLVKEHKIHYLNEISEYLNESKIVINSRLIQLLVNLVQTNLFRILPSQFNPAQWRFLKPVYTMLYLFISKTDRNILEENLTESFLLELMKLLDSQSENERNYLRNTLYLIYTKCLSFREFMRSSMKEILYGIIHEHEQEHRGIAQYLDIFASLMYETSIPKIEQKQILSEILIPLHKKNVSFYIEYCDELTNCLKVVIVNDFSNFPIVVCGMLKFWPQTSTNKEICFLKQLEELFQATCSRDFKDIIKPLTKRLAKLMCSENSTVALATIHLWGRDALARCLLNYSEVVFPIIQPVLYHNLHSHWNTDIIAFSRTMLTILRKSNLTLCNSIIEENQNQLKKLNEKKKARKEKWALISLMAVSQKKGHYVV